MRSRCNLTTVRSLFQSALPVRGAITATRNYFSLFRFQSVLPVRGAMSRPFGHLERSRFNPRSP